MKTSSSMVQTSADTSKSDEAQAIMAEFRDYAFSVSHDLSAPVRAMVEFSKLLGESNQNALSAEGMEYLAIIIENGHKLQAMMSGLLAYSRLNTMAKPFVVVGANRIVEDCCLVMKAQISSAKAIVDIAELPRVAVDVDQFMQIFGVLLDNALKFQPEGNVPNIKISAQEKDEYWQFAVADNGIGVATQYQQKIFKLFTRLHNEEDFAGVGIGLTLAQKIANRHGGKIWCESDTDAGGSIFYFTIAK